MDGIEWGTLLGTALAWIMIGAGLTGSLLPVPVLPGPPLIWLGMLVYGFATDFARVTWPFLLIMLALGLLGAAADTIAGFWAARRYGASKAGGWGSIAGGAAGVWMGGFAGMLLGPVIVTILVELSQGRSWAESWRAGVGALKGLAWATAARAVVGLVMLALFLYRLYG